MNQSSIYRLGKLLCPLLCAGLLASGCKTAISRKAYAPNDASSSAKQSEDSKFLKAHLQSGELWIFNAWTFHDDSSYVRGEAEKYDAYRALAEPASMVILPYKDVVLFETNSPDYSAGSSIISVMTGIVSIVGLGCLVGLAAGKSCFGSCPTFYVWDGQEMRLQAEGFSSSILPSLEARDIDALPFAAPTSRDMEVMVKNEAHETQVLRRANAIAVRKGKYDKVFHTPDSGFVLARNITPPMRCTASEGEITQAVRSFDNVERSSVADSVDLQTKETVEAEFQAPAGKRLALAVAFRQSLMSTYLLYQTYSYMGKEAGAYLSNLERSGQTKQLSGAIDRSFGGVKAEIYDGSHWIPAGVINEQGPIAVNLQAIELPSVKTGIVKVRLTMTKGAWRLNYLALAEIADATEVLTLKPEIAIAEGGIAPKIAEHLAAESQPVVLMPGDTYRLQYRLPEQFVEYEYFMDSKGYYLEWIRKEWLGEESPQKVMQLVADPQSYFREETRRFKAVEPAMEESFWGSRYVRP